MARPTSKQFQKPLPVQGAVLRVLLAVLVIGIGIAGWLYGTAHGRQPHGAAAGTTRAELLAVAERLFKTPGGMMDQTRSAAVRKSLEELGNDLRKAVPIRCDLVLALLSEAKTREAIDEVEQIFSALRDYPDVVATEPRIHALRGLAYLRLAEVENCVERHNDECCVFPLKGGGIHTEKGPAQEAAKSYLECTTIRPDDLSARWLLNVAHMAMGTYPDGVPTALVVPEKGPNSSDDFPRFKEVAAKCGFTKMNFAGGVIADDMDGDGLIDIVLSSAFPDAPMSYWRNRGDGTFEDRSDAAGVSDQFGSIDIVSTDYDNDGDLDIFMLRGAWLFGEGRIRKSLLRNEGNGTFTDVTRAAGLGETACPTQVGVWFDYDNDGDLDLFIGNESRMDAARYGTNTCDDFPCNLFRNNGDGTFTDVARQAGVTNDRYCKGATAGDYDNDGWIDLYLSNMGRNRLYHNNHDGTFTDVAEKLSVTEPAGASFAPWFFDFDNDGNLDIYVSAYDTQVTNTGEIAAWHLGLPFKSAPPRLYRNKGDGTFEDVTKAAGLVRPMAPMGANFGDLDNDGWLDMYLTTGAPMYDYLMPNVMLKNVDGKRFVDVTVAGGFGNLQKGHGVAFVDLDQDGDQDVFNEIGGFLRGDAFYNSLYENPGNANHFVTLKLVGTKTNRLAYGARIKVTVETPSGERSLHRAVGSVSSFGGSPSRQEIGLGDATSIKAVEIWWPKSGIRQKLTGLSLDSFYEITEGADSPRKLEPKRLKLGG